MKQITDNVAILVLAVCVLVVSGQGWSAETQAVEARDAIARACALIYQGQFTEAGRLLDTDEGPIDVSAKDMLLGLVGQYQDIQALRLETRSKAFKEQLDALDKLEHGDPNEALDPNAAPDPNEDAELIRMIKTLSVVRNASELATAEQRLALQSNAFVTSTIEKAVERATVHEAEGRWLEAYTECYSWLRAIDPNNQGYKDYIEELLDRVSIDSSFSDSPCETSAARYKGVRKEIFRAAITALNLYYINSIDYAEMASEALKRCKLVVEVVLVRKTDPNDTLEYEVPNGEQAGAWAAGMDVLLDEVKNPSRVFGASKFLRIFEKALDLNKRTAGLPMEIIITQFSSASLATLDPHTTIIWPREIEQFNKAMTNEFSGVGIEISKKDGLLTVASLLPDTPAYKAGLDAGDVIERVDGLETRNMSLHCAVKHITGPKGTDVELTIKRANTNERETITITRDRIIVPSVRGWVRSDTGKWVHVLDPNERIGYARLTSFVSDTARDFENVLDDLEADGLNGLILDLRFNSGGLLSSAVAISDMFIRKGVIVSTRSGPGGFGSDSVPAHARNTHPNFPLVVLVNSSSASASEIVSGALADPVHERAVLVGDRTHGKGSVQSISGARYGAQLKYTMAYYHLPSGQRVNSRASREKLGKKDWGVAPDVQIRLRRDELADLWDVQRDNAVLVQANHDHGKDTRKKHQLKELLKVDPQLALAILVVRAKQIEAGRVVAHLN